MLDSPTRPRNRGIFVEHSVTTEGHPQQTLSAMATPNIPRAAGLHVSLSPRICISTGGAAGRNFPSGRHFAAALGGPVPTLLVRRGIKPHDALMAAFSEQRGAAGPPLRGRMTP